MVDKIKKNLPQKFLLKSTQIWRVTQHVEELIIDFAVLSQRS
jgi:hypothetical protein